MNTVILTGRLTRDAKEFTTTGGAPGAVFTLAVANGKETSFIPCKLLGKSVKGVMPYLKKGKLVNFTGSLDVYNHPSEKMSSGYPVQMFNVTGWSVELLSAGNDMGAPSPQRQTAPNMANTAPNTTRNPGGYTPQQQKAKAPEPSFNSGDDIDIDSINDQFAAAANEYGIQIEDDIGF